MDAGPRSSKSNSSTKICSINQKHISVNMELNFSNFNFIETLQKYVCIYVFTTSLLHRLLYNALPESGLESKQHTDITFNSVE